MSILKRIWYKLLTFLGYKVYIIKRVDIDNARIRPLKYTMDEQPIIVAKSMEVDIDEQ